jgi:hypothetical protein
MKKRPFAGVFAAIGGVVALVVCLAAIDGDVREQVARLFRGGAPTEMATITADVRALGVVVFQAVSDQSIEHAPLVIFALAATVLLLFMLRT